MAAQSIKYVLGIEADTSQARKQIQELSNALNQITLANKQKLGLDIDLNNAAKAAQQLQASLNSAINVDTGKLNFTAFNKSLMQSNTNLNQLITQLRSTGSLGNEAVSQLARSLSTAEIPVKKMTGLLGEFATTLANSFKWQVSSNIIHGLESTMNAAVGYAKDLNETLNNIRIVTGQSVDDMAKFAVSANQAAKELSTTTKEFANASLIYYQQGDSAEMAAKKAATTVKAANVAFTASAKEMSEMLTAVWNSYQVGADQLETVVDVMAKLGATTASSMEEMATAMQKVASTANTVGVSMEQMSAIVATSASVTRQAPQTIGTAWNTILSRIGGLKLGETLEDGVDLNKYSKALQTIGVNILDANGQMRDMGGVIDEIGIKWQNLSKGQKAALAQTVGGARQYTQIMAFFDNFDKYQKNMLTAQNAKGALQEQQEIYAQGWEAASARSRAALEELWSALIDDEAVISFTNAMTKMTEGVTGLVKAFGGLPGILATVSSLMTRAFSNQIVTGVSKAAASMVGFGQAFTKNGNGQPMSGGYTIKQFLMGRMPNAEQRAQISNLAATRDILLQTASTGAGLDQENPFYNQLRQSNGLQAGAYTAQIQAMRQGGSLTPVQMLNLANLQQRAEHTQNAYNILDTFHEDTSTVTSNLINTDQGASEIFSKLSGAMYREELEKIQDRAINATGDELKAYQSQFADIAKKANLNVAFGQYKRADSFKSSDTLMREMGAREYAGLTEAERRQIIADTRQSTAQSIEATRSQFNPNGQIDPTSQFKAIGEAAKTAVTGISAGVAAFNQLNGAMAAFNAGDVVQGLTGIATSATSVAQAFITGGPWAGGIAIAGAALGAIVGQYTANMQKAADKAKEVTEKIANDNAELQSKIQNTQNQSIAYNDLTEQLSKGTISQNEFNDSLLNVANSLGVQGANVLALSGNYQELRQRVQETIDAQLEEQKISSQNLAQRAMDSSASNLYTAFSTYGVKTSSKANSDTYRISNYGSQALSDAIMSNRNLTIAGMEDRLGVSFNRMNGELTLGSDFASLTKFLSGVKELEKEAQDNLGSDYGNALWNFLNDSEFRKLRSAVEEAIEPAQQALQSQVTSAGRAAANKLTTASLNGWDSTSRSEWIEKILKQEGINEQDNAEAYELGKKTLGAIVDATLAGMGAEGARLSASASNAASVRESYTQQLKRLGQNSTIIDDLTDEQLNSGLKLGYWMAGGNKVMDITAVNAWQTSQSALEAYRGRGNGFDINSFADQYMFSNDILAGYAGVTQEEFKKASTDAQRQILVTWIRNIEKASEELNNNANNKEFVESLKLTRMRFINDWDEYIDKTLLSDEQFKSILSYSEDDFTNDSQKTNADEQSATYKLIQNTFGGDYQKAQKWSQMAIDTNPNQKVGGEAAEDTPLGVLISQAQTLADMDIKDVTKWKDAYESISMALKEFSGEKYSYGISLNEWLNMSELEKRQVQLDMLNAKIQQIHASMDKEGTGDTDELVQLEYQARQLQESLNDLTLQNLSEQINAVNKEWEEMQGHAEKVMDIISSHIGSGFSSFSDIEQLRQSLLGAGIEGQRVADIIKEIQDLGKDGVTDTKDAWAGVGAATAAALVSISADQQKNKGYEGLVDEAIVKQINLSEATLNPEIVSVPAEAETVEMTNAQQTGEKPKVGTTADTVETTNAQQTGEKPKVGTTAEAVETAVNTPVSGEKPAINSIVAKAIDANVSQDNISHPNISVINADAINAQVAQGKISYSDIASLKVQKVDATGETTEYLLKENEKLKIALLYANENVVVEGLEGKKFSLDTVLSILPEKTADGESTDGIQEWLKKTYPDGVTFNVQGKLIGYDLDNPEAVKAAEAANAALKGVLSTEIVTTYGKPTDTNKYLASAIEELKTLNATIGLIYGEVQDTNGTLKAAQDPGVKTIELKYVISKDYYKLWMQEQGQKTAGLGDVGTVQQYFDLMQNGTFDKRYISAAAVTINNQLSSLSAEDFNKNNPMATMITQMAAQALASEDDDMHFFGQMLIAGLAYSLGDAVHEIDWKGILAGAGLSEEVFAAFANELQTHSPSRLTEVFGKFLIQGLDKGLVEAVQNYKPDSSVSGLSAKIFQAFQRDIKTIGPELERQAKEYADNFVDPSAINGSVWTALYNQKLKELWDAELPKYEKEYLAGDYLKDDNLSDEEKVAMKTAIATALAKHGLKSLNDAEVTDELYKSIQQEIDQMYMSNINSLKNTTAEIQDIWKKALDAVYESEDKAAQRTYETWQKTFQSIVKAREALLKGQSITDAIGTDASDMSNLLRTLMIDNGMTYDQAVNFMNDPNASLSTLNYNTYKSAAQEDYWSFGGRQFFTEKMLAPDRVYDEDQMWQEYNDERLRQTTEDLNDKEGGVAALQEVITNLLSTANNEASTDPQKSAALVQLENFAQIGGFTITQDKVTGEYNHSDIYSGMWSRLINAFLNNTLDTSVLASSRGYQSKSEMTEGYMNGLGEERANENRISNKSWEEQAKRVGTTTEKLKEYAEEAKKAKLIGEHGSMTLEELAAALYRQGQAYEKGRKQITKWVKTLNDANTGADEYTQTIINVRDVYGDLLDLTSKQKNSLSEEFLKSAKNAELFEAAAKGSEQAYDTLAHGAALDIAKSMGVEDNVIPFSVQLDENTWQNVQGDLSGFLANAQSWINDNQLEIDAGKVNIDAVPFFEELSQMQFATQESAAAMQAALSAIGVDAEIIEEERVVPPITDTITTKLALPTWKFTPFLGYTLGAPLTSETTTTQSSEGHTEKFFMLKGKGFKPTTKGGGGGGKKSGGGGGGGGGKSHTKKESKRVADEGERYHEIRDKIEQQEHILDRIDKIKDRAYGGRHLKALNDEIKALEKQNELQKEYYAEAAAYLASDRAELSQYGATFNPDGTINYDEYIRKQVEWYNNSVGASEDDEVDKKIEEEYKDRMKALENYEEALDLVDTIQNDILDKQNEISELLLETTQYKLEIAVELNDKDIERLDYYINKWSEILNRQDESMEVAMMKMSDYENSLAAVGTAYDELQQAYAAGQLNDTDYQEGLADLQDKTLSYLESINDLKKEISDYYENTLSLAEEKQAQYTDKIEHTRDMMQSYIEMQQLMGRGQNFAELNSMYDTSYRSSLLTAKAARDYLDTLYASRAAIIREIENSGWTDILKEQYDSVEAHIIEAENTLAEKTSQTLEDAKAKFQNTIEAILKATDLAFKSLVDANGNLIVSFDEVAQDFEYWNEQQGWYVSTAKELYEVSKINRQIEDSLVDTTTLASKERLKALKDEINAYSEKNRLTEYDIEMNELQYKMALAMQNLEDAQNAKSTVRLTRDENGNYGYQYTADQNEIDDARQNFEDVLQQINELSYEHQNDLIQQMIESKQNYQQQLKEILDDDTLSLEERNRQAEVLTEQHLAQMEYIQEQGLRAQEHLLENQGYIQEYYGQTIIENTGLVQDQIHNMMQQLMQDSGGYVEYIKTTLRQQLDDAINGYSKDISDVGDETGLTWGTMENSVSVYDKTNEQAAENIKALDEILGDSLKNISSATATWLQHNVALETTIGSYEQLLSKLQDLQTVLADIDKVNDKYYNNGAIDRPSSVATTAAINALYADKNRTNFTEDRYEGSPDALGRLHNTTMSEYSVSTSKLWDLIDGGALSGLLGLIGRGVYGNITGGSNNDALSQTVNINANFDNIQSAQDIIDAFNQLTNLASQYAYNNGQGS